MDQEQTVADLIRYWSANETWRRIDGWPYEISSFGNIRRTRGSNITDLARGVSARYAHVTLSDGERRKTVRIHILVAKAFLGPPPFEGAIVAHGDNSPPNCNIGNLRWASARENQRDRIRHSTMCRGSRVHGAKLKEEEIPAIRERLRKGEKLQSIADDYNVSKSTVHLINKNKIWRAARGASWSNLNV